MSNDTKNTKRPEIAADDWGFSKGINDGILELAQDGIIQVVSLIANSPHLEYRLDELQKVKDIKLAWHMNFSAGKPIEKTKDGSCLIDPKTQGFHSLITFIWHWLRGNISEAELKYEARAQIKRLKNLVRNIDEADGHHHIHLVPGLLKSLESIYREFEVPILRLPMERTHLPSFLGSQMILWKKNKYPNLKMRVYGYPQTRHFVNSNTFLESSPDGRPLLVHPAAYNDFSGNPYGDPLCEERVVQYNLLREWFL